MWGVCRAGPARCASRRRPCAGETWPTETATGTGRWWSNPERTDSAPDRRQSDRGHAAAGRWRSKPARSRRRSASCVLRWHRLRSKWTKELDYRLVKELWAFDGNRIAVSFACEWHDDSGNWLLCAIQDAQGRPGLSFVHPSERITVSTKCFFLISPISIERHDPVGGQVNTLAPRGGSLGGFSKSSIPTRGMEAFLKSICYHDLGFIVVESAQTLEFRNGLRIH